MLAKGERSRQAMIDAAHGIMLESGIESLSHSAIAAKTGLTKSAVHWHFPTKRSLWEALIADYVEHLAGEEARHEAVFVGMGFTPEEAVLPAMKTWYEDFRENRRGWVGIGSALIGLARHDPELVEPIRAWYRGLYGRIEASGLDKAAAFAAMMTFDGFFNSSKMGILVLSAEETNEIMCRVLRDAYADRPVLLEKLGL